MTDRDQLIAVAEEVLPPEIFAIVEGAAETWNSWSVSFAFHHKPNWIESLDACFADIVPAMRKEGLHVNLCSWDLGSGEINWHAGFRDPVDKIATVYGEGSTPARAIVQAFLMHRKRWTE